MKTVCVQEETFREPQGFSLLLEVIAQELICGCLQVFSDSQTWLLYLEQGRLIYACQTRNMWEILAPSLFQLCPKLGGDSELKSQLQEVFTSTADDTRADRADYLTICYLVEKQYLSSTQAGKLIEQMAATMLEELSQLKKVSYQFLPQPLPEYLPKFCHLDIALLTRRRQLSSFSTDNLNFVNLLNTYQPMQAKADLAAQAVSAPSAPIPPIKNIRLSSPELVVEKNAHSQVCNENDPAARVYKIMCIDDSPVLLKTVQNLLDTQIFSVIGVDDPLKALMQILRSKPDLILLDISMPQLNGYELCTMLRRHANFATTPVVMLSARTGLVDKARARMVKASGYLTKPFTQAQLLKVVFSQLSGVP